MAEINHEIKINASIETVYQAINTLNGLRAWYALHMEGSTKLNDILMFQAKDKPSFNWKIIQIDPEKKIVWECLAGPGDSIGTKAIFQFTKTEDDRTLVEFSHTQWPGQHGNYRKCNTLWGILLHHLQKYSETGKSDPTFK